MCEEFSPEASDLPTWDVRALSYLRSELHSSSIEFFHLMDEEELHPAFDPIQVRNLLRDERAEGHEPELLILGRMEMASFRHFISRGFGEESGAQLNELFFLGIPVTADLVPSRLEFVGEDEFQSIGQNVA